MRPAASYLNDAMPAKRASAADSPNTTTQTGRDIHPTAPHSAAQKDTGRPGLRLVLILVTLFMAVLDFAIVNIALPSMEREVNTSRQVGAAVGAALLPAAPARTPRAALLAGVRCQTWRSSRG